MSEVPVDSLGIANEELPLASWHRNWTDLLLCVPA